MLRWPTFSQFIAAHVLVLSLIIVPSSNLRGENQSTGKDKEIEPDSSQATVIKGVVVQVDRIPQTLFRVPASASILNITEQERVRYSSMGQLVGSLPGVRSYPTGNTWGQSYVDVRGFYGGGQTQYLMATYEGIPLNDISSGLVEWNGFEVSDMTRIESVRGPVSAQYGDFGFGGIIALYSAPNGSGSVADMSLAAGSYHSAGITGRISKFVPGWSVSTSATRRKSDGWRQHSAYLSEKLSLRVDKEFSSKASLMGIFSYDHSAEEHPGALTEKELLENRTAAATDLSHNSFRDKTVLNHFVAGLSSAISILENFEIKPLVYFKSSRTDDVVTIGSPLQHLPKISDFGADVSLGYNGVALGRAARIVGGVAYEQGEVITEYFEAMTDSGDNPLISGGMGRRTTASVYIHGLLYISGPWFISLGGRVDNVRTFFDYKKSLAIPGSRQIRQHEFACTPKAAVGTALGQNFSIYASVVGAFKSPTLIHLYDSPPVFNPYAGQYTLISNSSLKSQKGNCYEAGLRAVGGNSLSVSLNYYYYLISNEIDFDLGRLNYTNIGKSCHSGFEMSISREIIDHFSATGNFNYNSSRLRNGEFAGNQINGVPEFTYDLEIKYDCRGRRYFLIELTGIGKEYLDQANEQRLKDYYDVSIACGFMISNFKLGGKIDNVLDRRFSFSGYVDPFVQQARYYPAPERNFMITISASI
ncbi:MAG: TonB-dependent receptor [candidate division Zixibacteria bacterium]|nr:TonB-dependent receptor [candidate division Zixibacteria bacterium]